MVGAKLDAMPEAMRKAFNISSFTDFSDLLQYFAYCFQYIAMAGCIYSAILGASSLIKEESDGTIEFLYSKPVSRTKIVTAKLVSNLLLLIVFNTVIFAISFIGCMLVAPENYQFAMPLARLIKLEFIIQAVYFSIGFMISTVLPSSRQANPAALGIFFITYILGIFSQVIDKLKNLKYISPYNYALPANIVKNDYIMDTAYIALIISIIFISMAVTYLRYNKKDMRI
ncbi:MAG: ABC transporter permease subunit [Clostridiaceae bacterium]